MNIFHDLHFDQKEMHTQPAKQKKKILAFIYDFLAIHIEVNPLDWHGQPSRFESRSLKGQPTA